MSLLCLNRSPLNTGSSRHSKGSSSAHQFPYRLYVHKWKAGGQRGRSLVVDDEQEVIASLNTDMPSPYLAEGRRDDHYTQFLAILTWHFRLLLVKRHPPGHLTQGHSQPCQDEHKVNAPFSKVSENTWFKSYLTSSSCVA